MAVQQVCQCSGGEGTLSALHLNQEKADGRLLLHSQNGHKTTIIRSPDTDVEVLVLYHVEQIQAKLFLVIRAQQRQCIIGIKSLACEWVEDICKSLLRLHAFTGADSTSAFCGKGKKVALDLLERDGAAIRAM